MRGQAPLQEAPLSRSPEQQAEFGPSSLLPVNRNFLQCARTIIGSDVPVFLAHGGVNDIYDALVLQIEFDTMTEFFADKLVEDGHFTILCRHGFGHYFTQGVAVSGLQFLSAHSWENTTSFWQQNGLPGSFASSCSIH